MFQNLIPVILDEVVPGIQPIHPLHVVVAENDIQKFNLECAKKPTVKANTIQDRFFGVLFKKEHAMFPDFSSSLCVTIQAMNIVSNADESDCLHLYVTPYFLSRYFLTYGELMYFRTVSCFPLTKVVFGVKNAKSYEWTKTESWQQQFLLTACQNKTLCHIGEPLLISPAVFKIDNSSMFLDFITLECQPFGQGILTVNTTIVITNVSETVGHKQGTEATNMISCLNLTNYTNSLYLAAVPRVLPLSMPSISTRNYAEHLILQPQVFPKLLSDFKKALSAMNCAVDVLNTIFLSAELLKKIGVKEGCWVKANICTLRKSQTEKVIEHRNILSQNERYSKHSSGVSNFSYDLKGNTRLVTLCCVNHKNVRLHSSVDGVAYMSPHLWFNLNHHPSKLIQHDVHLVIEPVHESSNFVPPYAEEVYISLVQSPNYNGTISCETMLTSYFKYSKYIHKGDVFCINIQAAAGFQQRNEDPDNTKPPAVYFRISMIEGIPSNFGHLIDKDHTRLYQAGTIQSYIPMTMESYYYSYSPFWDSPVPSGIQYYVEVLQELILPFLRHSNSEFQMNSNILLTGPACCGKSTVVKALCRCLNLHLYEVNCSELLGESSGTSEAKVRILIEKASVYAPCIMLLKNIDLLEKEKELKGENSRVLCTLSELLRNVNSSGIDLPVIVIATTTVQMKLISTDLTYAFLHHVYMESPNEEERSLIIEDLTSPCLISNDVSVLYLAQRTAGFVLGDLCALVSEATRCTYSRIRDFCEVHVQTSKDEADIYISGIPITQKDLLCSLEKLQADYADSIGAPKIPNIYWEDVGGLADIKQEILDTIQLPLEHPEILCSGLRRSGVLLYGPPGTGKTLIAKAVATECSLNFLSVKGPELINMYVGQSEENVRDVFQQARSAAPCIIFFDELDSLAPNRGRSGDSGGVMDRVVSQLLAELDGLNKSAEVFVIGATNRPDLIDPALLRPGRFDRVLYVGIPEDKSSKLSILKALTRRLQLSEDVDLEIIVDYCPDHVSGADLYSLCSDAMMICIQENIELIENGEMLIEDANLHIQQEDFYEALHSLIPSVSTNDLFRYQQLKYSL